MSPRHPATSPTHFFAKIEVVGGSLLSFILLPILNWTLKNLIKKVRTMLPTHPTRKFSRPVGYFAG
jgi:hypothetical protein